MYCLHEEIIEEKINKVVVFIKCFFDITQERAAEQQSINIRNTTNVNIETTKLCNIMQI